MNGEKIDQHLLRVRYTEQAPNDSLSTRNTNRLVKKDLSHASTAKLLDDRASHC